MKRTIIAFALATTSATAVAAEWFTMASTRSMTYDVRAGSLERTENRDGEPVVVITVRTRAKSDNRITFERNYVRVADCAAGQGKLVTVDLDGDVKYTNDFVLDGGSVASGIAETICLAAFPNKSSEHVPTRNTAL